MSAHATPVTLPPAQVLELSGADAIAFAHAQFSSDVSALQPDHWQWSCWLSPQGRVRFFFMLLHDAPLPGAHSRLRLLLRGGSAETFRDALARFVFRAKVSLRVIADAQALGCDEISALARLNALPSSDALIRHGENAGMALPGAAPRWLLLHSGPEERMTVSSDATFNAWQLGDIRAGLPELAPALHDQLLPQWLALDRLGAINVRKGCYPGQEIMARLHFKGGTKRSLYRIECRCDALPSAGTALYAADAVTTDSGVFVASAWTMHGCAEALAVIADTAAEGRLRTGSMAASDVKVVSRIA